MITPTPVALAAMLYQLNFPKGTYSTLPASVQEAYRRDAERLIQMLEAQS